METLKSIEAFENGKLYNLLDYHKQKARDWNPHPKFKGVYLKHLITGSLTNQVFSSHIVRIDPDCTLDEHIHEGKMELHEVMRGSGVCILEEKEFDYSPGDCTIIPADKKHKVIASGDGLILLAKFMPALL